MAGLDDLFTKYKGLAEELAANRDKFALQVASDVKGLVANRMQNSGVDSTGRKMKLYSASYKAKRQAFGLPVDKRTTTFTGDMWADIRPEIESSTATRTVVLIKARSSENQEKVNYNSKIIGLSILGPNTLEQKYITDSNQERIDKIKEKYTK